MIESRPRSGLFVIESAVASLQPRPKVRDEDRESTWVRRLHSNLNPDLTRTLGYPDAFDYPYPFISSQPEITSFPTRAWARAINEAMTGQHLTYSIRDSVDEDDPLLIEALRKEILPSRGITAEPDQILLTIGTQQGLSLISDVLVRDTDIVGVENPGYLDAVHILSRVARKIEPLPTDSRGARCDELSPFDICFVTPSHHHPTNVTLSLPRRRALLDAASERDGFVIEDDYDSEFRFRGRPTPSLKSLDTKGRVVYLGSFSKFLAAGLRIGFVVADAPVIAALRAERHHRTKHLPGQLQRALAIFISTGEYHKVLRSQRRRLKRSWELLVDAVDTYLPEPAVVPHYPPGGVCLWYTGPDDLNAAQLSYEARRSGILVSDGSRYFYPGTGQNNCLRIGFASISHERIDDGIALLGAIASRSR